ncbi:hypothetical protein GCM10009809_28370 [Isoptericola hypogeus]|uniref:Heparinase II/III-like protein n=1 Tax=Isoptericola hypogeus TaxID=300179 RepID=A0ABN2JLD8_9MICO
MADHPTRDPDDRPPGAPAPPGAPPAGSQAPRRGFPGGRLSRRAVLVAGAASAGAVGYAIVRGATSDDGGAPTVRPSASADGLATPAGIDRSTVAGREQPLAAYGLTIARLANGVGLEAGRRGLFGTSWWRDDVSGFNARVCEQVLSLAWFYANDRPWHPYAGDPALLEATDALLDHYLGLQHDDGSWPELAPDDHSTAATAFALGYLSRTLAHLGRAGALPRQQRRIREALARGSRWFLTPALNPDWSDVPLEYTNQLIVGLAGSALAFDQHRDPAVASLLAARVRDAAGRVQSPAGFLYEAGGMDIGYNLAVALPRIAELHRALGAAPFAAVVDGLAGWWGLALLPEPDGSGFVTFVAASTRTQTRYLDAIADDEDATAPASSLVAGSPGLAAFLTALEDRADERRRWAGATEPLEPDVPNPRVIANLALPQVLPARAERQAAVDRLPPVARARFVEVRTSGRDQVYLFVRRPRYYLQACFGPRASTRVRAGLGTLWTPGAGTFVHASAGDDVDCAWGAVGPGREDSEATSGLRASVVPNGAGGAQDLAATPTPELDPGPAPAHLSWADPDGRFRVDVRLTDTELRRSVTAPDGSVEQVPLLLTDTDRVSWADGTAVVHGEASSSTSTGLTVVRGATTFEVRWSSAGEARTVPVDVTYFRDGRRRIHLLQLPLAGTTAVRYTVT